MTTARRITALVLLLAVVSACDLLPGLDQPAGEAVLAYPDGCAAHGLSAKRCERIVAWAATQQDIELGGVDSISLLGDPGCGEPPAGAPAGGQVLCTRTTQFIVRVRFQMADGRSAEQSLFCGVGGQFSALCSDQPQLSLYSPTESGYFDIPAGSTPIPTAAPDALAQARPLEVATLDIPIDHLGPYEVRIGEAWLPNGLLREATLQVLDQQPDDFLVGDGVRLDVEPRDPDGPPLWNAYEAGWQEGTRRVEVFVRFDVTEFEPGAVLALREIVVR